MLKYSKNKVADVGISVMLRVSAGETGAYPCSCKYEQIRHSCAEGMQETAQSQIMEEKHASGKIMYRNS